MATAFQYTSSDAASIFDIFSEDSLRCSLKPAWDFLMRMLTQKYPNHLLKALKYTDEVYYVIMFIIEEYNLRNKSASMTESFYELKRESTSTPHSFTFRHAKTISLVSLVLLPYIEEKLRNRYEKSKEKLLRGESSGLSSFDHFLCKWFPMIETLSKWIRMLNYVLYLFKYTGYAMPLLKLTSFQLKYNTGDNKTQSHTSKGDDQQQRTLLRTLVTMPLDFVTSTVTRIAPLLFYSLSFLETFYQQDGQSSLFSKYNGSEGVPPPAPPKVLSTTLKLPSSKKLCPLCHQAHKKPSTLPVSGFVYCYRCIQSYLQRHGCCPVTYRSCPVESIIPLYTTRE